MINKKEKSLSLKDMVYSWIAAAGLGFGAGFLLHLLGVF